MKKGNLWLGFASWGFRETPLEEQLKMCKKYNVDLLELGIHGNDNDYLQLSPTDSQINEVKRLFDAYGVKFYAASTGNDFTSNNESDLNDSLNNLKDVILTCEKLNIKYLRIFAGFSHDNEVVGERFDNLVKYLTLACDFAKLHGVTPVIETHGGVDGFDGGVKHFASSSTNIEKFIKTLELIPSNACVNFDPANLGAVGFSEEQVIDAFNKLESKIKYIHLKDFKKVGNDLIKPTYLGDGQLDFSKIMPTLEKLDVPAFFEYENVEDIEFGLSKCLEYTLNA